MTVLTATMEDPHGYGRIVREGAELQRIVEEKDATPAERQLCEINTGIYAFEAPFVFEALTGCDPQQCPRGILPHRCHRRRPCRRPPCRRRSASEAEEAMGINDRVQLAEAGALMRQRINERLHACRGDAARSGRRLHRAGG